MTVSVRLEVTKNAIGTLSGLISRAKDALRDIEREVFGGDGSPIEGSFYAYPHDALKLFLEQTHDTLMIVLEAAEFPETRVAVNAAWIGFKKDGLTLTNDDHEFQSCQNPALTFFERTVEGLRAIISEGESSEDAWTLNRLEAMLRDTAGLVHRRAVPTNELDVQKTMHDYLSACFPDFRLNPPIGGGLKTFKPDCGIASVGAAIEFKFVRTKKEVAIAASGIFEDSAGYRGSKDWTRFYSVVYQAEPFMLESHLRSDLQRVGAALWKPIVVNGAVAEKTAIRRKMPTTKRLSRNAKSKR